MFTLICIQASQIDSFQQSWQHWWRRLRRRESETFWGERCWPTFCQGNGLVHGNKSCLSVLNFVRYATSNWFFSFQISAQFYHSYWWKTSVLDMKLLELYYFHFEILWFAYDTFTMQLDRKWFDTVVSFYFILRGAVPHHMCLIGVKPPCAFVFSLLL